MADWQPIETAPNNVFDVCAKYWDAGLDQFLMKRITDCVKVNDVIYTANGPSQQSLTDLGYKPLYWTAIPEAPNV